MISEVLNTIFLTYLATEYLIANDAGVRRPNWQKRLFRSHNLAAGVVVALLNVLDRLTGAAVFANNLLQGFLHLPKVLFAAICYVLTLYADCKRVSPELALCSDFLPRVGWTFLRVLPAYPFLAVLISFGFLFVINIFEFLRLPLELLNWPIYYGTLYGPFSFVYFKVKQRVVEDRSTLPSTFVLQG
jgi:hypothetical protein